MVLSGSLQCSPKLEGAKGKYSISVPQSHLYILTLLCILKHIKIMICFISLTHSLFKQTQLHLYFILQRSELLISKHYLLQKSLRTTLVSTTLSLDLCPSASPQFTGPWNGKASSPHGNHPKMTAIPHFSYFFKCEIKTASS